ncbi:MAG: hypothetical protein ACI4F7_03480, partial [Acutalibacteraceae bacterium]
MYSVRFKSTQKCIAIILSCLIALTLVTPSFKDLVVNASVDESINITSIKEAWSNLREYKTVFNTVGAIEEIPEGTSKESKKCTVINPVIETERDELSRLGTGYATYDVKAKEGRTTAVLDNDYTVFTTRDTSNADLGSFELSKCSDAFIYLKINSVTTEGKLGFKYGIGWGEMRSDNTIDIKKDMEGSWIKITADQVCCTKDQGIGDWRSWFKNTGSVLRYWAFQPLDGAEANITFGSLVAEVPVDYPDNTAGWNLSDWIYEASKLDLSQYINTEEFTSALEEAKKVKLETSGKRSYKLTECNNADEIAVLDLGNNLLSGYEPTATYYDGEALTDISVENPEYLTDGGFENESLIKNAEYNTADAFTQLVFESTDIIYADYLMISGSRNPTLRSCSYDIYISEDRGSLFEETSLVISYASNSALNQTQIFDITSKPETYGKFVGVRVRVPAADMESYDSTVRFAEIGVFGASEKFIVDAGEFTDAQINTFGVNRLKNSVVYTREYSNYANSKGMTRDPETPETNLFDGKMFTKVDCFINAARMNNADDQKSFSWIFDMKKSYNIQKVFVGSHYEEFLQLGKYEIYASKNINNLFSEGNKIISYDNTEAGPNGVTLSQLFTMADSNLVARYVAIRFVITVSDFEGALEKYGFYGPSLRIAEFGVYGSEYQKPLAETNYLKHAPVTLYRTDSNGVHTEISESEYSGEQHSLIYDGDYSAAATVDMKGQKLDYVFNLSNSMKLHEFKINALSENIKVLKIYVSDIEDKIWSEQALVYTYSGDATSVIDKLYAETPVSARYLRISVISTADGKFNPTELEAIGWNDAEFDYIN